MFDNLKVSQDKTTILFESQKETEVPNRPRKNSILIDTTQNSRDIKFYFSHENSIHFPRFPRKISTIRAV
ncbi:hypothetical protein IMY05_005G0143800 [Salix suchowensis]|nr:hypothetical protein IMY05_005G0143800 [Salix suchowensis]